MQCPGCWHAWGWQRVALTAAADGRDPHPLAVRPCKGMQFLDSMGKRKEMLAKYASYEALFFSQMMSPARRMQICLS